MTEQESQILKLEKKLKIAQQKVDILEGMMEEKTRQLYIKNQQLEKQKQKETEQFIYTASHDLQEPIHTILSFINLLKEEKGEQLDTEAQEYLSYCIHAGERMRDLLSSLLDYNRIGREAMIEKMDSKGALDEVLLELAALIMESKATIKVGPLPVILANPSEIKQIFQNLIANGIKFARKGVDPVIEISAERKGEYWQYAVKDNGIGIHPRNYEKIFLVFRRLNKEGEYPGMGIGLAVCKKIVSLYQGDIWVTSEPDKGSTFYFTIRDRQ